MREPYTLTNAQPKGAWSITWQWPPRTLTIQNNSNYPAYVNIGSREIPSSLAFDEVILPNSLYNADPAGARDFAVSVDNSPAPGVPFNFPVTVTFSSGAGTSQNPL